MTQIIAEACNNHLNNNLIIERMIKLAAETKIDYIKFQLFNSDNLNTKYPNFVDNKAYYKAMQLSERTLISILELCDRYGIKPLFTTFDIDRANILKIYKQDEVKIASPDANNYKLLDYCLSNFKHIFISTGMSNSDQIIELRKYLKDNGVMNKVDLFYCVSKYPTNYEDVDFDKMIMFDGFSDHTTDIKASIKAIELEIPFIERHFTLGKDLPGRDHHISSTIDEFKRLVEYRDYKNNVKNYKGRWVV